MPLEPPAWIDNGYIRKSIQDGEESRQILVKSFETSPAVPPGNNFGSNIWRVKVKYQEKPAEDTHDLSLIVKAPLEDEELKEVVEQFLLIEPKFYSKLLPILADDSFAPKSFFSAVPNAIVMEDLSAQGYLMADRLKGLDFDHCRIYATASATFHAATVAAHKKNPELVESLGREKIYTDEFEMSKAIKRVSSIAVCCMADEMEKIDDFKKYAGLVRSCADSLWNEIVELHKKNKTFNSLGQGDPWTTNMMFKYDSSGKVDGIKLLDFQVPRFCSPVADLVFFIWASAGPEVRKDHLEEIYHLYCDSLNDKLKEFKCHERLPYDQLLATIKSFYPFILHMVAEKYPILKFKEPHDVSLIMKSALDETLPNESVSAVFSKYLTKEYCEEELPKSLKELESIGMFRFLESKRQ